MKRFAERGGAAVAAAALAISIGACAGDLAVAGPAKKVTEKVFPFASNGEVSIESRNGRIAIEAWDRPEVRVQITRVVRGTDDKQAQDLLRELRADVELLPGRLEIVSRYPKRRENVGLWDFLGRKVAAMDIHYYLQVPKATALTLHTTNGEIRVRGVAHAVEAITTNGDVRVSGATGSVEVQTTNGTLELLAISGDVTGSTTNGSVRAEVRSLDADGNVELTTTNGNVVIYLPPALRASITANTTNGKVMSSFPLTLSQEMSSKSIRGTIGGAGKGAELELATTNGNILVKKIGERGEP